MDAVDRSQRSPERTRIPGVHFLRLFDADEFRRRVEPFLLHHEAEHGLMLGVMRGIVRRLEQGIYVNRRDQTPNGIRINPVYTPEALRGRGRFPHARRGAVIDAQSAAPSEARERRSNPRSSARTICFRLKMNSGARATPRSVTGMICCV